MEELIHCQDGNTIPIKTEAYSGYASELGGEIGEERADGLSPNLFVIIKLLGKGATGRVFLVRCTINNKVYAMKVSLPVLVQLQMLDKGKMSTQRDMEYAIHERRVLSKVRVRSFYHSQLKNPFLVTLFCSFQTSYHVIVITMADV